MSIIYKFDDSQFRHLVESIEDYAIYVMDVDGHICSWNNGAKHIKGYSAEEVIGQHFSIFYPKLKTSLNPSIF